MILKEDFSCNTIYFDSAATTLKPEPVIQAYCDAFDKSVDINSCREIIAEYINCEPEKIKFTRGTTHSLNLIAKYYETKIGRVSLPISEHHSNMLPWRRVADVNYVEFNSDWSLKRMKSADVLAISHVSNVLGSINRISDIDRSIFKSVIVDGAQAPSHIKVNVTELDCDFYAFSGHKIYGPTGIGILYDRDEVIKEDYHNFPAVAGLAKAIEYLKEHIDLLLEEERLTKLALDKFKILTEDRSNRLKIIGPEERAPIISFTFEDIHPHDVASLMNEANISLRAGHMCTQPLMDYLSLPAVSRISFGIYNDEKDLDRFFNRLIEIRNIFK